MAKDRPLPGLVYTQELHMRLRLDSRLAGGTSPVGYPYVRKTK